MNIFPFQCSPFPLACITRLLHPAPLYGSGQNLMSAQTCTMLFALRVEILTAFGQINSLLGTLGRDLPPPLPIDVPPSSYIRIKPAITARLQLPLRPPGRFYSNGLNPFPYTRLFLFIVYLFPCPMSATSCGGPGFVLRLDPVDLQRKPLDLLYPKGSSFPFSSVPFPAFAVSNDCQ